MTILVRVGFLACWVALGGMGLAQTAAAPTPVPVQRDAEKLIAAMQVKLDDWAQLGHYREANKTLAPAAVGEDRVVFYGASMTEFWGRNGSEFFPGKPYVNRGVSGQTTPQMVARFRQDVVNLHPKVVVILGGGNDVAGNTGPMTAEMTEDNWQSMADLARENGIKVVFASLTPSTDFPWRRGLHPAEKIRALNVWLKGYCASHGLIYLDYYSALTNAEGGMKAEYTVDGVHASVKGYEVMAPLAQAAIDKALGHQ
ncbi:lysophospholipase L1-like esterase [Edaphobacter aggregans]|uniref:Lysophospholipase L1-like esterase n=1 Tax=Edaphobacter aggregans TaxID=570835 RepID=A0A428MJY8_9BACT|nr:SGNH/GDSL hydrolase family protein [Edaphobacter aggregans]RSL17192.1 lysophospholipase L1-like esterase [Edaphobacter aggregans]